MRSHKQPDLEVDLDDVRHEGRRPLRQLAVTLDRLADVWHEDRVDGVVHVGVERRLCLVGTDEADSAGVLCTNKTNFQLLLFKFL